MLSVKTALDPHYHLTSNNIESTTGDPPGVWYGSGALALHLRQKWPIDAAKYLCVFSGFHPRTKEKLTKNAGHDTRQNAVDCVFSAPKSVSTLWSQLPTAKERDALEGLHRRAVLRTLDYLESVIESRRNRQAVSLVFGVFHQSVSRANDPQLHSHAVTMNIGFRADGKSGAIDTRQLFAEQDSAGALYRLELAHLLEREMGLKVKRRGKYFELADVNPRLMQFFSKRRQAIEKMMNETGAPGHEAVIATRPRKQKNAQRSRLLDIWQSAGVMFGFKRPDSQIIRRKQDVESTLVQSTLSNLPSEFTRRDLVAQLAVEAVGQGINTDDVIHLCDDVLTGVPVRDTHYTQRGEAVLLYPNPQNSVTFARRHEQTMTLLEGTARSMKAAGRQVIQNVVKSATAITRFITKPWQMVQETEFSGNEVDKDKVAEGEKFDDGEAERGEQDNSLDARRLIEQFKHYFDHDR